MYSVSISYTVCLQNTFVHCFNSVALNNLIRPHIRQKSNTIIFQRLGEYQSTISIYPVLTYNNERHAKDTVRVVNEHSYSSSCMFILTNTSNNASGQIFAANGLQWCGF